MHIKNLRIATKLWIAVGLIILTLGGMLVGTGLWSGHLQQRMDVKIAGLNYRIQTINHWSALTQANAVRALAIVSSSDPHIEQLLKGTMDDTSAQISLAQKKIDEMLLDDTEKAAMEKIGGLRKHVRELREQAYTLKNRQSPGELLDLLHGSYLPASNAYLLAINEMSALEEHSFDTLMQEIKDARDQMTRVSYILIALLLLAILAGTSLLIRSIQTPLEQAVSIANQIADGNLAIGKIMTYQDEFGALGAALSRMISSISGMVATVSSNAVLVADTGYSQSAGNRELSARTKQQAVNLGQTSVSVQDVAVGVQRNAENAVKVDEKTAEVRCIAENGATTMKNCVESVESIQRSAHKMNEIIGVIDGLAFQTNILALNAAIEAARAGESGRGFAVVATEVRMLAQHSARSAGEIRQLIMSSSVEVESSVVLIRQAGEAMDKIADGVRQVAGSISQISSESANQSTGISHISDSIRDLDEITQTNSHMVEVAVNDSALLEIRANTLRAAIGKFKLQQGIAEEANALVQRAVQFHRSCRTRDAFLNGLTESSNHFFDRDMYVFGLDDDGQYIAFGGNPAKIGTRLQSVAGVDGAALLSAIIGQCKKGPGWIEYDFANPVTNLVQKKMSYVMLLGGVYIGCGVYSSLAV